MIDKQYLDIFAKIPPLPQYYDILDSIRWLVYFREEFEFEESKLYDSIVKELTSLKTSLKYDYHSIQKAFIELTDLLIELGWIERKLNKLKVKEKRKIINFFKFIRDYFKHSITRLVAWAVWYIYNQKGYNFKLSELLQILPEYLDKERIIRILKKLRVDVYDDEVSLNDLALQRIVRALEGKVAYYWPSFGIHYVKGTKFFKILRGQSATAYVDIPNQIFEELVSELTDLDRKSSSAEEFFEKASKIILYFNKEVLSDFAKDAIGMKIDWLKYNLERNVFLKKNYGLRVRINWKRFVEFLDNFAKSDVELWRKYRYLTHCRISATSLAKRGYDFTETIERVKSFAQNDIEDSKKLLDSLVERIKNTRNILIRKEKIISKKYKFLIPLLTITYLFEMESTIKASKSFVEDGVPSMWYKIARSIIENLAWSVFEDFLTLNTLKIGYYPARFYFDIPKEWKLKRQPYDIKTAKNTIHKKLLRGLQTIKHEKELKDKIISKIIRNMSYPLFIALFGNQNVKENSNDELMPRPIINKSEILEPAKRNLEGILNELNVSSEVGNEIVEKLNDSIPEKIMLTLPSNRFVLEFVDENLSTKFYELWDSYSFFVHSNFTSWYIVPFTSVLEFKILKNKLIKFSNEIRKCFEKFLISLK